ncbi:hypothetical protein C0992_008119 [Termitomyces sp. T32_za158]|nr:hypothetical protein C0992_008119 [Termitomyces sp. T32_za158]
MSSSPSRPKPRILRPTALPVRTVYQPVHSLDIDAMRAIVASTPSLDAPSNAPPLSPVSSPSKKALFTQDNDMALMSSASPRSTPSAKRKAPASDIGVNSGLVAAAEVSPTKKKRAFLLSSSKQVASDVINNDVSLVNADDPLMTIFKTEKALAAEELKTQTLARPPNKSPAKSRAAEHCVQTHSDVLTSDDSLLNRKRYTTPVSISDDDDSMPEVSRYQLKKVAMSPVHDVDVVDDEIHDVDGLSRGSGSPGSLVDFVVADGSEDASGDERVEDHSDCVPVSSDVPVSLDDSTDPAEIIDYSAFVMQPSIQDPLLVPTYKNLPYIASNSSVPVELVPFGYDRDLGDDPFPRARFSAVGMRMHTEDFESLTAGMRFVQYGFYVNFARIDPNVLESNNRRVALKGRGKGAFCISIMCGVVSASNLFDSWVMVGPQGGKYKQHRITLIPFFQEIRRDVSIMCLVLGLEEPLGTTSCHGFAFVSRGEGKKASFVNRGGYASPKKAGPKVLNDSMIGVESPKKSNKTLFDNAVNSVVDYDDTVPVYDGRFKSGSPFRFTPANFDAIQTWPSFRGGRAEVPEGSVVAVGYSANYYTIGKEDESVPVLTTNVLFVIVLSTPENRVS